MFRRVFSKVTMAGLALAIVFSAPVSAQDADPSVMANMVLQVQELQDEVRNLRGMMEEQAREIENLKRRQRDQYLDLDQRISDIRNTQPIAQSGAAPSQARAPQVSPPASAREDVPEVREPMESQSQVSGIGAPTTQTQSAPTSAADEKAAYDQAFQALKELRYADAAEEFQSFLDWCRNNE